MSVAPISACSGLMYSGVPMICPRSVKMVLSVSVWLMALATPKSMTLTMGVCPSPPGATRMLEGLISRWMMPFMWACWTASQTEMKSSRRWLMVSRWWSAKAVIGSPLTCSITKYGRPVGVTPPSSTFARLG